MFAKVTQIDLMSESYHSNCDDFDSKSNVKTFVICLLFIAQWALEFSYPQKI
jgi:hypothetical protein